MKLTQYLYKEVIDHGISDAKIHLLYRALAKEALNLRQYSKKHILDYQENCNEVNVKVLPSLSLRESVLND